MKLWQKKTKLDPDVERFTVGDDCIIDAELVRHDVRASKAHARMLERIGILSKKELAALVRELDTFARLHASGKIKITIADEDGHTALENYLTKKLGEAGKKIHTGRSRNDQSLAAIRLYMREEMDFFERDIMALQAALREKIKTHGGIKIPGYTHMQKAMPSSIGLWLGAFVESLQDDIRLLHAVREITNQSPLGSAAGYGSPLPLDRILVARELAFSKVQENTLYVQNSRGKFELMALAGIQQAMLDIDKLCSDLMLFSTAEFGFVSLPAQMTTGSSIMPQKRNLDVVELSRARVGQFMGYKAQIEAVIAHLPSGYNRDFQLTKESFVKGMRCAKETVRIMAKVIDGLTVDEKRCAAAMTPELFATHKAYELVKKGMTFRDAYRKVGEEFDKRRK